MVDGRWAVRVMGPGDFLTIWDKDMFGECSPNDPAKYCSDCAEALAKYESWRLKAKKPSNASPALTYPQAVEIIRNVLTALGGAEKRGFSYGGEWRSPDWLLNVLEVVLKGSQPAKPDVADDLIRETIIGRRETAP